MVASVSYLLMLVIRNDTSKKFSLLFDDKLAGIKKHEQVKLIRAVSTGNIMIYLKAVMTPYNVEFV